MRRSPIPLREKLRWFRENLAIESGRVNLSCLWCRPSARGYIEADEARVVLSENFEWDHLAPVSRGGGNDADNLMPTCRPCNRRKRDRHPHEFADYLADLGIEPWATWAKPLPVPCREETVGEEWEREFEERQAFEERLAQEQQDEIDEELWHVAQNPRGECRLA